MSYPTESQRYVLEQIALLGTCPQDLARTLRVSDYRLIRWLEGTLPSLNDDEWEALDSFFMKGEI